MLRNVLNRNETDTKFKEGSHFSIKDIFTPPEMPLNPLLAAKKLKIRVLVFYYSVVREQRTKVS